MFHGVIQKISDHKYNLGLYTVGHKKWHFTFVHIFANYWPIFKILSLAHFADNLQ